LDPYRVVGFAFKRCKLLDGDLYIIKKPLGQLEAIIEPITTHPKSDLQRYLDKGLNGTIGIQSYYLGKYEDQQYHITIVAEDWECDWMSLIPYALPRRKRDIARMSTGGREPADWPRVLFNKLKMYLN
jgi:hypothetical protein